MKNIILNTITLLSLLTYITSCEPEGENATHCEDLTFTYEGSFDGDYYYATFKANEISDDENVNYTWLVDEQEQDTTTSSVFLELSEGEHEICVSIETTDCPEGVNYCETINISKEESVNTTECTLKLDINTYNDGGVFADIEASGLENEEGVYYEWKINDEYYDNKGDNYLLYQFEENGNYTVCVLAETPECPMGVTQCEIISIDTFDDNKHCEGLTIESQIHVESSILWEFKASGIASDYDVYYSWMIDNEFIDSEHKDILIYKFTENGSYEVKAFTETPECPTGTETSIIVEVTEIDNTCDIKIDAVPNYKEGDEVVNVSFEAYGESGIFEVDNWFLWNINEKHISEDDDKDTVLYYTFTENGTYEICFEAEIRNGCESVCKTVVIDQL